MSTSNANPVNLGLVAIIGKSSLFPVSLFPKTFWPNLLALKGLLSALAMGEWPFSEFLTTQDLSNLKSFFKKTGLPTGEFEIPAEVLKISTALQVIPLYLANQALKDSRSFQSGLIPGNRVMVGLEPENNSLAEIFARHHGLGVCPVDATAPLPGSITWISSAIRELQAGNADMVIAGSTDNANSVMGWLKDSETKQTTETRLREGLCVLSLRRLADAKRDNDQILAVISDIDATSIGFISPESIVEQPEQAPISKIPASENHLERLARFARLPIANILENTDGTCRNLPFNSFSKDSMGADTNTPETIAACLDQKLIRESLVQRTGSRRFFHDLLGALFGAFVSRVVVQDPEALAAVSAKPVIYLANHQIGIESPLFMALSLAMTGVPIQAVAKPDHIEAWLSFLLEFAKDSLGSQQPFTLMYFDRQNPQGLIDVLKKENNRASSLLVHVEGTRSLAADQPVAKISSVFLDMAIEKKIPIVPVRFIGGLPSTPAAKGLDFPYENGKQDYFIGAPILPEQLQKLFYGQRPKYVMEKINSLGPDKNADVLLPPTPEFIAKTRFFTETFGLPKIQAMLFAILQGIEEPCEETEILIKAVKSGKLSDNSGEFPPVLKKFLGHLKTKFA